MTAKNTDGTKVKVVTVEEVSKFLMKTGFILEMEVAEKLKKEGYDVNIGEYFVDYDEDKKREIDVIASKKIGGITVTLVIECKQSLASDWVFVCSDKNPSRYYSYVKFFPEPSNKPISKSKVFDHLHILDPEIPLAQNYIVREKSGKQGSPESITTCVKKLPKAVVYETDRIYDEKERNIIIPVAVFSGKLFKASYDGTLDVETSDYIQYAIDLDSRPYTYKYSYNRLLVASTGHDDPEEGKNSPVSKMSQKLGSKYMINFVSNVGVVAYLKRVETDVGSIEMSKWPVKRKKKN